MVRPSRYPKLRALLIAGVAIVGTAGAASRDEIGPSHSLAMPTITLAGSSAPAGPLTMPMITLAGSSAPAGPLTMPTITFAGSSAPAGPLTMPAITFTGSAPKVR